jgi:Sulfate permease family
MSAPEIFRSLKEYRREDFAGDLSAGLTVGVIALPLAIGFGIASGVTPGRAYEIGGTQLRRGRPIASRMPCNSACGLGGQPGM